MNSPATSVDDQRGNARGRRARERLLQAALAAFATRGFHGTSSRDIAHEAGMSAAAMYTHYASKELVLFELSRTGHTDIKAIVDDVVARYDAPVDQLQHVIEEFAAWHARWHTMARVVQYEFEALNPAHAEEIAAIRRAIEMTVRRILRSGKRSGVFRVKDPARVSLAVLSLGIDVARWYRDDGKWTPADIGRLYGDLALRMAGADPDVP